jgi:hypothetical protein
VLLVGIRLRGWLGGRLLPLGSQVLLMLDVELVGVRLLLLLAVRPGRPLPSRGACLARVESTFGDHASSAFRGIFGYVSHKTERKRRRVNRQRNKRAKRAAMVLAAPMVAPVKPTAGNVAPKLLGDLARALNALESHGISVQLANDAVITNYGYVFDFGNADANGDETWQVRTRMLTEFSPPDISASGFGED